MFWPGGSKEDSARHCTRITGSPGLYPRPLRDARGDGVVLNINQTAVSLVPPPSWPFTRELPRRLLLCSGRAILVASRDISRSPSPDCQALKWGAHRVMVLFGDFHIGRDIDRGGRLKTRNFPRARMLSCARGSRASPALPQYCGSHERRGNGPTEQLVEAMEAISECPSVGSEPGKPGTGWTAAWQSCARAPTAGKGQRW